jgi:hypothetical protein
MAIQHAVLVAASFLKESDFLAGLGVRALLVFRLFHAKALEARQAAARASELDFSSILGEV